MKKHLILLASGLLLVSGVAYTADTQTFSANLTATESKASNDTSPELFANSYSVSGDTITTGTNGSYKGQSNYNASSLCNGYNGFKNITINGGTLISIPSNDSTIVRLSHATNVHVNGITLKLQTGQHLYQQQLYIRKYHQKQNFIL